MGQFKDVEGDNRFEQAFDDDKGAGLVWADYAVKGDARIILHVEAEPSLRGSGAGTSIPASDASSLTASMNDSPRWSVIQRITSPCAPQPKQ